jgi:hypothetical protein
MGVQVLSPVEQAHASPFSPLRPPEVVEQPVFADSTGRRTRLVSLAGRALACVLLLWLVAVAAGIAGLGTLPGVPDIGGSEPAAHGRSGEEAGMPEGPEPSAGLGRDGGALRGSGGPPAPSAGRGSAQSAPFRRGSYGEAPRRPRGGVQLSRSHRSNPPAQRRARPPAGQPAEPPPNSGQAPSSLGHQGPQAGRQQTSPPAGPPAEPAAGRRAPASQGAQGPPAGRPAAPAAPSGGRVESPGEPRPTWVPGQGAGPATPAAGEGTGPPAHAQGQPGPR